MKEISHEKAQKRRVKGHQRIRVSGRRISGNQEIRRSYEARNGYD